MPALQPLDRVNPCLAARGQRASEAGGFSCLLRRDEQRRYSPGPSVLDLRIQALKPKAGAAVQARAQRSAAHKAGASMPRPAAAAAGHQTKGLAAIERASRKHSQSRQGETMAVEQTAKNLEEMIEMMFKVARKAIQSAGATPLQRSAARTFIERHTDLGERRLAHLKASEDRQQARLARRSAVGASNMAPVPQDFRSRARRAVGLPTAEDQAAQLAQEQGHQAKLQEKMARKLRDTTRESRNQAQVAFELAIADFLVQFPKQFPSAKPAPTSTPTQEMAPPKPTWEQNQTPKPVNPPRPSLPRR